MMRIPSLSTARFAVLVALVLALFSTGIVVGAAGAPLILGQSNSSGGAATSLRSTNSNGTLKVTNTGSGRALEVAASSVVPLKIVAPAGSAPMTVNQTKRVAKLNADRVDGKHASGLVRSAFDQEVADVLLTGANQALASVTMSLPGPGYVLVQGSLTAYSFAAGCGCETAFAVTDGSTTSAYQRVTVGDAAGATNVGTADPQYVFSYTSGGTKTFTLQGFNFSPGTGDANTTYRSITALFVPFGSTGVQPTAASAPTTGLPTATQP